MSRRRYVGRPRTDIRSELPPIVGRPKWHAQVMDADRTPEIRRFDCQRYDPCLSAVSAANWPGFSCVGCPAFVEKPPVSLASLPRRDVPSE